jgi:FkbM family methyltransferase
MSNNIPLDIFELLKNKYRTLSNNINMIPLNHIDYLKKLKAEGFEPKVIYDIGSCVMHWTKIVKELWPNAEIICFEAFNILKFLYEENNVKHFMSVLSDKDDEEIKFYVNYDFITGNSYYKENNEYFYNENNYIIEKTITLDTLVKNNNIPYPDFIKIDVQGCEIDILNGGLNIINHAKRMIIELQTENYNKGAPKAHESLPYIESLGWKCCDPLFQNNGPDGDYGFINENKIIQ